LQQGAIYKPELIQVFYNSALGQRSFEKLMRVSNFAMATDLTTFNSTKNSIKHDTAAWKP
jgi:hypothetical protein